MLHLAMDFFFFLYFDAGYVITFFVVKWITHLIYNRIFLSHISLINRSSLRRQFLQI